jgi:hypothetical protein
VVAVVAFIAFGASVAWQVGKARDGLLDCIIPDNVTDEYDEPAPGKD